jgi:hypothetical protein
MSFVGFHLEGPAGDSGASVWGLGAPDPAERPRLEVSFSEGAVPEPPGALLIGLGLAGVAALARWRDRRAKVYLEVPEAGGARRTPRPARRSRWDGINGAGNRFHPRLPALSIPAPR